MKPIRDYIVDLDCVQEGVVEDISLSLADEFFARFENAPMHKGSKIDAIVQIRQIGFGEYDITINIDGVLNLPCSRCLADMEVCVSTSDNVKVRYGMDILIGGELVPMVDQSNSEFDYTLEDGVTEFDLSWSIFEVIMLAIPIQNIHRGGLCDSAMLNLLQEHLAVQQPGDIENEASESSSIESLDDIDPRWNELKKILNNN